MGSRPQKHLGLVARGHVDAGAMTYRQTAPLEQAAALRALASDVSAWSLQACDRDGLA